MGVRLNPNYVHNWKHPKKNQQWLLDRERDRTRMSKKRKEERAA